MDPSVFTHHSWLILFTIQNSFFLTLVLKITILFHLIPFLQTSPYFTLQQIRSSQMVLCIRSCLLSFAFPEQDSMVPRSCCSFFILSSLSHFNRICQRQNPRKLCWIGSSDSTYFSGTEASTPTPKVWKPLSPSGILKFHRNMPSWLAFYIFPTYWLDTWWVFSIWSRGPGKLQRLLSTYTHLFTHCLWQVTSRELNNSQRPCSPQSKTCIIWPSSEVCRPLAHMAKSPSPRKYYVLYLQIPFLHIFVPSRHLKLLLFGCWTC